MFEKIVLSKLVGLIQLEDTSIAKKEVNFYFV